MIGSVRNLVFVGLTVLGLAGCGGSEPVSPPDVATSNAALHDDHAGHDHAEASKPDQAAPAKIVLTDEEKSEIAKLTDKADQDAAIAQAVCPISGENLGSMGVPIKMTADGKNAYLCCNGCKKSFEKDPAAALAKLAK